MKYTKEHLTELVNNSKSMWEVVTKTGMSKQQGNYTYLSRIITRFEIDKTHFEDQRKGSSYIAGQDNQPSGRSQVACG